MIAHYIRKVHTLGYKRTLKILQHRAFTYKAHKKLRFLYWFSRAQHTWTDIAYKTKGLQNFEDFLLCMKAKPVPLFIEYLADQQLNYIQLADTLLNKGTCIFGTYVSYPPLSWHSIVPLGCNKQKSIYSLKLYYQDIVIGAEKHDQDSIDDIRTVWELSRFNELFILGQAYQKSKDERYVSIFQEVVSDWLENNTYLEGPNWICPMEVAIRSINWIAAFWLFKDANIETAFWQRFVCSLYDHMIYLEHHWELYDTRTNNHYLSNLVGYFYLTYFFQFLHDSAEKINWVIQEFFAESEKQIFVEGTDYEGSTYYHKLVAELHYLFLALAEHTDIEVPHAVLAKLERMVEALSWWTPEDGELIQIGDNDSGKVLTGLTSSMINHLGNPRLTQGIAYFDEFGISIIKRERVHISLRHHAYQREQPSGHFHNDIGSCTIALDGIPVVVDPGTYLYTSSTHWRNYLRSVSVHNTSYIDGQEPVLLSNQLFSLDIPEKKQRLIRSKDNYIVETSHDLYKEYGLIFNRSIKVDEAEHAITIIDWWEKKYCKQPKKAVAYVWNFTLHPLINAIEQKGAWLLYKNGTQIASLTSTLLLDASSGWYSHGYGQVQPTQFLQGKAFQSLPMVVTTLTYG